MSPHRRAHRSVEPISSRLGQASRGAARAFRAVGHQTMTPAEENGPPISIERTRTRAAPRRVLCIAVDSAPRRPSWNDFASTASSGDEGGVLRTGQPQGDPGNDYGNRIRAAHRHRFARGESEGDVSRRGPRSARRVRLRDGRALAERLGYAPADLDAIPSEAIDSFAGVGYYLTSLTLSRRNGGRSRQRVGTDSFIAAGKVGKTAT